jgi:ribosomal protein L7/L12
LLPAFRIAISDVRGFSIRKATRDDKKRLGASSMQQVLVVQGLGTTLAEVAVNYGTAQKIEAWFRAHPLFGSPTPGPNAPINHGSVADELTKLAGLRDAGVLSGEEFEIAKARTLAGLAGGSLEPMAAERQPVVPGAPGQSATFNVMLADAGRKKIPVIKIVRDFTNLGLREAKDLIDTAPNYVLYGVDEDSAVQMQSTLQAAGATATLEEV